MLLQINQSLQSKVWDLNINSNISHQTTLFYPYSFYIFIHSLYKNHWLICVYFYFTKSILRETSVIKLMPKSLQTNETNQPTANQTNVPTVQTWLGEILISLQCNFPHSEDKIILSTAVLRQELFLWQNPMSLSLPELKQWIMKYILFQGPNA